MAKNDKNAKLSNLKPIKGHPGLYTVIEVSHNPQREKALMARIARDAEKRREETYLFRILAKATR